MLSCLPQETSPIRIALPSCRRLRGLPESPWHESRPPSLYPAQSMLGNIFSRRPTLFIQLWHSSESSTSTSTFWSIPGEVDTPYWVRPQPIAVAFSPVKLLPRNIDKKYIYFYYVNSEHWISSRLIAPFGGRQIGNICGLYITSWLSSNKAISFW